jgi:L-alanine-DL-glutamate epimerase-like enolase superfamily enzyme
VIRENLQPSTDRGDNGLLDSAMTKIKSIEYFRVLPRWLFVKICDEEGYFGWGESTLEGHSEAVEGTLNALIKRYAGYEAEYVQNTGIRIHRYSSSC